MIAFALTVALGLSGGLPQAADKELRVEVTAYQGDPLGSRAEGTLRCLCESVVVTRSGRSATVLAGGKTPIQGRDGKLVFEETGLRIEVLPIAYKNNTVWVETDTVLRAVNVGLGAGGLPGFTEQNQRTARIVDSGQKYRIRVTADSPTDQTWFEVTVREVATGGK